MMARSEVELAMLRLAERGRQVEELLSRVERLEATVREWEERLRWLEELQRPLSLQRQSEELTEIGLSYPEVAAALGHKLLWAGRGDSGETVTAGGAGQRSGVQGEALVADVERQINAVNRVLAAFAALERE